MYRRYRKKRRFGGLPEATFSVFDKITGSYDFVLIIRRCDLFCVSVTWGVNASRNLFVLLAKKQNYNLISKKYLHFVRKVKYEQLATAI